MPPKRRVLIVCTGNSCRSQLAEALWRARWGDEWDVHSAGSDPTGEVHPLVFAVLAESRVDSTGLESEALTRYSTQEFDLVVTVCDPVPESCATVPGARRSLHWPFPDPAPFAAAAGREEALGVFRTARDAIQRRIHRYLDRLRNSEDLGRWLRLVHDQLPSPPSAQRSAAFLGLVEATEEILADERDLWADLPGEILERYEQFGWAWNGIYAQRGTAPARRLELVSAAGPPVCASIEEQGGGFGSSGMCFDALLSGHPVAAADVKRWPGYLSCDRTSGLQTVAGLVVPIHGPKGPVAVWDLDSTAPLDPSDSVLFGALITRAAAAQPLTKVW